MKANSLEETYDLLTNDVHDENDDEECSCKSVDCDNSSVKNEKEKNALRTFLLFLQNVASRN